MRVCSRPGCPELVASGRCDACKQQADRRRGSAASRGYDNRWARRRRAYLARHPICVLCGGQAQVADHYPTSRRDLLALRVGDVDADHHLRPLCLKCHASETARHQPGGWAAGPPLGDRE
jgi:5-methylcytosine-specific restriction protein A